MKLHRIVTLSVLALAMAACKEEPQDSWNPTTAPAAVEAALSEQVGAPFTVMVERPNEWGWICGSVTTPGEESRFFVWDGTRLTVQPTLPDDPTPEQSLALLSFTMTREGCLP